jgi:hypothetical protein
VLENEGNVVEDAEEFLLGTAMVPVATTVGAVLAAVPVVIISGGKAGGGTGAVGVRSAVCGGGGVSLCRNIPVKPPDMAGAGAPPVWVALAVSAEVPAAGLTVMMIRLPSAFMV